MDPAHGVGRTDARSYAQGEPVEIAVRACNETDRPHEEYYPDSRFRAHVLTDDDRNVAFGAHGGPQSQRWEAGQCRDFALVWDQTEGAFEDDGGQDAWPGDYRIELDWRGVQPPPEGIDPGVYDPALQYEPALSEVFTIEATCEQNRHRLDDLCSHDARGLDGYGEWSR